MTSAEPRSRLDGKVAVVLGASAEGGTGWAIAEGLADAGAEVVVAARTLQPLEELADKIGGAACACDASSSEQVAALAAFALDRYGRLDVAVNSAALPMATPIADCTADQLMNATQVNYFANVHFVRSMAEAIGTDGSIVLISSMASTMPIPPHFAYASAKAATDCMVRYAALEYGPRNIRVNSVLPGSIRSAAARPAFDSPDFEEVHAREVPLGRVGEVEDFADVVVWLAGPAFVTGLNLPVCGGNQLTRFPRPDEWPEGAEKLRRLWQ